MWRRDEFRDYVFCCLIPSALATCRVPVMSVIWPHFTNPASLIAQLVKNLPAMQETPVLFLGREDLLEKGKSTLAWRIPWTIRSMELQRVGRD